jgi:hypothetical protein
MVAGAALGAAALTPTASAAERHASPGGADPACSAASPCSIAQAVQGAGSGDEVIVHPGDYTLTAELSDPAPITIHGIAGQPRPRLLLNGSEFVELHTGSTLRYVEIDQTDPGGLWATGALLDQVIVRSPNYPVFVESSTVRNSIVVATGTNGIALRSNTAGMSSTVLRNVTAIATGSGGIAVDGYALGAGANLIIGANNVLARGGPGGASFRSHTNSLGGQATIGIGHSNYAPGSLVTGGTNAYFTYGGGNVGLAPLFVDPAAGDYRQAPGSPTIGAGLDDVKNGELDVDGDPRAIGITDIGADEFVPAPTGGGGATGPGPAGGGTDPAATPSPTTAGTFAGVRLVSTRLTMSGRIITLRLSCPAGTVGRCSGRTTLTASRRRTSSRPATTVILGRAPFSIGAGRRARVRVRVSSAGRRLLRAGRRVREKDRNVARDGVGHSKGTVAAVTIRRRVR